MSGEANGSTPGIYRKIADVLGRIGEIPKTGKNSHFGYSFHEEQVVVEHLRPMLAEVGVVVVVQQGDRSVETSESGHNVVVAPTSVTFVDADDGSSFTATAWGEGQDTQDKGSHKALVGAFKYALMKTFLISSGKDDPEHDHGNHRNVNGRGSRATQDEPECPECGGPMWDNRGDKPSPRSPDYKCKDKDGCGHAIWLDSARESVAKALRKAHEDELVTEEQLETNLESVEEADLDMLRATADWVRSVRAEATEQKEATA